MGTCLHEVRTQTESQREWKDRNIEIKITSVKALRMIIFIRIVHPKTQHWKGNLIFVLGNFQFSDNVNTQSVTQTHAHTWVGSLIGTSLRKLRNHIPVNRRTRVDGAQMIEKKIPIDKT